MSQCKPIQPGKMSDADYQLPDGSVIKLGEERYKPPEGLFQPAMMGLDYDEGIADLVKKIIAKRTVDIKRDWCANIVLAGGSTMFENFAKRIEPDICTEKDIKDHAVFFGRYFKVKVISPPNRQILAWQGGSFFVLVPWENIG